MLTNMKIASFGLVASIIQVAQAYPQEVSHLPKQDLSGSITHRTVTEWTAMGDSYASGVGAGPQEANDNYLGCFRFPLAYPPTVQSGPGSLQPNPRRFNNVACSGNTFQQILDKEFLDQPQSDGRYGMRPVWGNAPEFATITMGGNDIGILNLVLTCIYSLKLWGNDCDTVIANGFKYTESDEFTSKAKEVIQTALTKSSGTRIGSKFKFFVTGYAQFFNQEREQCNTVTFKRPWAPGKPIYLTVEKRTSMNKLATALNTALENVVKTFPSDKVYWVNYDAAFDGHRFCDHDEPSPNNDDTWFFNWDDNDDAANEALFGVLPAFTQSNTNTTNSSSAPTFKTDSDYYNAMLDAVGNNVTKQGYLSDHFRVFHPKPAGHAAITAALVQEFDAAGIPQPGIPTYKPGGCGMHITQYQKHERSGPNKDGSEYLIDVTLADADGSLMPLYTDNLDSTKARFVARNGEAHIVKSVLPFDMSITVGAIDSDAVLFHYNDQDWGSNDQAHHSNFGAYDHGKREGDTGFAC